AAAPAYRAPAREDCALSFCLSLSCAEAAQEALGENSSLEEACYLSGSRGLPPRAAGAGNAPCGEVAAAGRTSDVCGRRPEPEPYADQKTARNGALPKVASGTSTAEARRCSSGAPRSWQQRPRVVMKVEHVSVAYSCDLTVRLLPGSSGKYAVLAQASM